MKILAADDQPMILKSIGQKMSDSGFDIIYAKCGQEAIELFDKENPDLVILDLIMPNIDGFGVIEHIREKKKKKTPIIVMSGMNEEDTIIKAFEMGVDDYVEKPVGINEMLVRTLRLLKLSFKDLKKIDENKYASDSQRMLQKKVVGVVIPCYNEEDRLSTEAFADFAHYNLGYHLCFVNDGSTDNTLDVLNELKKGREDYISVYDLEKNGGKAEAVRQGILYLSQDQQINYFGYLDADLSTDFSDFSDLAKTLDDSNFKIVSGSRMSRMGANITKESARAIISKTINLIIRSILGMSINDTQCGAKVMDREVAENMFNEPFLTKWLFDVEIFMRMKKYYGKDQVKTLIYEQPLKRWIHADGSKLSMKDSIKIMGQLLKISYYYK